MKTCLIVDDVEVTRFTSNVFIEELGLKSIETENGECAIAAIKEHDINVVLLDWHVKKENGLIIMKDIHKIKPTVPVIMFTAVEGADKEAEALQAGAVGFIIKPTTKEKLKEMLKKIGIL